MAPGRKRTKRAKTAREIRLEKALRKSNQVLDDWIVVHASDCCSPQQIEATRSRISPIGTLAYISMQISENRETLKET